MGQAESSGSSTEARDERAEAQRDEAAGDDLGSVVLGFFSSAHDTGKAVDIDVHQDASPPREAREARGASQRGVTFRREVDMEGVMRDIDEQERRQQASSGVPRTKKASRKRETAADREWKSQEVACFKEMLAEGCVVRFHDPLSGRVFRTRLSLALGYVLRWTAKSVDPAVSADREFPLSKLVVLEAPAARANIASMSRVESCFTLYHEDQVATFEPEVEMERVQIIRGLKAFGLRLAAPTVEC